MSNTKLTKSSKQQLSRKSAKPKSFGKKDFSIVSADWTGSESYWTATGSQVYTTNVGVDTSFILMRYIDSNVNSGFIRFELEFPDSDEWYAGYFRVESYYANVTKREIHIFEKIGGVPSRFRIDAYDGSTLLCSYYLFRELSDSKSFKYGIRVKHLLTPDSFYTEYSLSDDSSFAEYGIVLEEEYYNEIYDETEFVGKTYYASIPTAYLPEGQALVGNSSDNNARLVAFVALVAAVFAIIYSVMNTPPSNSAPKPKTA